MSQVIGTEDGESVIVATLVRGKNYTFHDFDVETNTSRGYHKFERAVPTPVDADLADKLEALTEDVPDSDGELITKDMFKVERDTLATRVAPVLKRKRLRLIEQDEEERPVLKAPARKPIAPAKKPGTFGSRRAG